MRYSESNLDLSIFSVYVQGVMPHDHILRIFWSPNFKTEITFTVILIINQNLSNIFEFSNGAFLQFIKTVFQQKLIF